MSLAAEYCEIITNSFFEFGSTTGFEKMGCEAEGFEEEARGTVFSRLGFHKPESPLAMSTRPSAAKYANPPSKSETRSAVERTDKGSFDSSANVTSVEMFDSR